MAALSESITAIMLINGIQNRQSRIIDKIRDILRAHCNIYSNNKATVHINLRQNIMQTMLSLSFFSLYIFGFLVGYRTEYRRYRLLFNCILLYFTVIFSTVFISNITPIQIHSFLVNTSISGATNALAVTVTADAIAITHFPSACRPKRKNNYSFHVLICRCL